MRSAYIGISQCITFASNDQMKDITKKAQLLVVSPMRRTSQTATLCFPDLIHSIPWIGLEYVREQSGAHPCDRRRPISEQAKYFPYIDYTHCTSDIDDLYALYPNTREPDEEVTKRGLSFINWIKQRPETDIIIVTHSAYIKHILTTCVELILHEDEGHIKDYRMKFNNCEMRSYRLPV